MDWKLAAIYFANLLCCLIYDIIAPFYPIEAKEKGVSNFEVGLVFTTMPLVTFVFSPIIGFSLKHFGRRLTFSSGNLVMVLSTQGVSMSLMALADLFPSTSFFIMSVLSRALSGVGSACVFTVCTFHPAYAFIASDYPSRMNEIIALNEVFSGLGLMIGPVVGSAFYYLAGYRGMFYLLGLVFVAGAWVIYALLEADKDYVVLDENTNKITAMILHKEILVNCLPLVYSMAAIGFCDTVIAPHLHEYGLSQIEIGFLWALSDTGYAISSLFLAKTLEWFNLKRVNLTGLVVAFLSYWLLGPWEAIFPKSPLLTMIGLTLISVSVALHYVAALPNLVKVATEDLELPKDDILIDSLSGIVSSANSLGEVIGPLVAGLLVDEMDVSQAGGVQGTAGVLLTAIYLLYYLFGRDSQKTKEAVEMVRMAEESLGEGKQRGEK